MMNAPDPVASCREGEGPVGAAVYGIRSGQDVPGFTLLSSLVLNKKGES